MGLGCISCLTCGSIYINSKFQPPPTNINASCPLRSPMVFIVSFYGAPDMNQLGDKDIDFKKQFKFNCLQHNQFMEYLKRSSFKIVQE